MDYNQFVQSLSAIGRSLKRSYAFLLFGLGLLAVLGFWIFQVWAQQPITLNVLMTAQDTPPWREGILQKFAAKYPNIRLNLIGGPNATNLIEDLYTSAFLLGDSPYDLVYMDVIWTSKFAAAGWLLDLSDRISATELAAFSPQAVEGGRYQGKLYRIPVRSDAGVLYYRQDLLKEAGFEPPETFSDLLKISQTLQQTGKVKWGYLWQGRQYEGLVAMFVEVLAGHGGFWVNPETLEVGLDRPETLEAIAFLQTTLQKSISPPGVTTYQEEETRQIFQSGQAAFLRSWPYVWPLANQPTSPIQGKIGLKPMVHLPNQEPGACLGGWGLGIAKSSRHPQEAWTAIQYLTSLEVQRQLVLQSGYIPTREALFSDPAVVSKYSHYPILQAVTNQSVLRPPIAQYAQASDILQRYLSAALTNRLSPQQAMQAAASETRRLLSAPAKQRSS